MAANFLKALAIQFNNEVYLNDGVTPGQIVHNVPTPSAGGVIDGDYWAIPVNEGVESGFNYYATDPDSTDAPDPQAFHVVRISQNNAYDKWWLLGTSTEYAVAAETVECCGDSSPSGAMPLDAPSIAPCQTICENADGDLIAVFGIPTKTTAQRFFPFGYINGVALPDASASGYTTTGTLLTFLNANWTTGALTNTWAVSADGLTLTNTLDTSPGNDEICAVIAVITP